ncbi:chromosomal replication initiator protein DnaA [Glycomyces algeriensis]|uniref:chromosomal replication initiator protein DnaA n=1 Tax=Glycomyces algeriensis TaxID=256037 RepID=UPI0022DD1108|nr:chromosomal replication initiator protein DnaA [Glycomyces algeriensis]
MTDQDLSAVWSAVSAELADASALTRQQSAWMRLSQPVLSMPGTFIVAAPDKFARSAFESKLRVPISEALSRQLGQPTQIAVTLQEKQAEAAPVGEEPPAAPEAPVNGSSAADATIIFERPAFDQPPVARQPAEPVEPPAPRGPVPAQNPPSLFDTSVFRPGDAEAPRAPEPERPAAIPHQPVRPAEAAQGARSPEATQSAWSPEATQAARSPEATHTTESRWDEHPPEPPGEELERVLSESAARQGNKEHGAMPPVAPPPSDDPDPARRGGITKSHKDSAPVKAIDGVGRLNPRYNFDTFVIGSSNRFAHAAAFAVAEAPAKAYNPLFLYGGSGLGKTHLLHAVGHYAHDLGTAHSVRYVTTEEFTNDFINSLSDRRQQAFQRRYRDVDILLIDDIQFLMDRERTQEEFFHTFNALHNANKQLVISSDRSPKQLQTLEDRLRTRFEWGLLADIQPPDLETRIAILRKKAVQDDLNIPTDAVEFIATQIHHSIRELEGALIRVTAYASLNRKPVDLGLAEEVLHDIIPESGKNTEVTVDQIMQATADYFGVASADLKGNSRSRVLVNARQVAMYLCRELTDMSLPRIGQAFGGRDHTTVMHANKKIRKQMAERRALYTQIAELTNRLKHTGE